MVDYELEPITPIANQSPNAMTFGTKTGHILHAKSMSGEMVSENELFFDIGDKQEDSAFRAAHFWECEEELLPPKSDSHLCHFAQINKRTVIQNFDITADIAEQTNDTLNVSPLKLAKHT